MRVIRLVVAAAVVVRAALVDRCPLLQIVEAEVPMAEMSSYTIYLRSMTQGRGSFSLKFARYEEAPAMVQQKIIDEAKAEAEAE